jgi:hypothetical protein
VERWTVKVLTATNTSSVNFSPKATSIYALGELDRPASLPDAAHVGPYELETFTLKGCLFFVRQETDADYHLALGDPTRRNDTLVAEIPDASCADVCDTRFAKDYANSLEALLADSQIPRPASVAALNSRRKVLMSVNSASELNAYRQSLAKGYLREPRNVELVGVGFFDFAHGQIGKAPNTFELHPVLTFKYLQGTCNRPDQEHLRAWIMQASPSSD